MIAIFCIHQVGNIKMKQSLLLVKINYTTQPCNERLVLMHLLTFKYVLVLS